MFDFHESFRNYSFWNNFYFETLKSLLGPISACFDLFRTNLKQMLLTNDILALNVPLCYVRNMILRFFFYNVIFLNIFQPSTKYWESSCLSFALWFVHQISHYKKHSSVYFLKHFPICRRYRKGENLAYPRRCVWLNLEAYCGPIPIEKWVF